jgi:DNA-binding MarR family transcriptional regulator
LPILRSQQQGEILALLLGDPDLEISLTEIAERTGAPHPSVYREIQRAEQAGLVTTRKVGNTGWCGRTPPAPTTPVCPTY